MYLEAEDEGGIKLTRRLRYELVECDEEKVSERSAEERAV